MSLKETDWKLVDKYFEHSEDSYGHKYIGLNLNEKWKDLSIEQRDILQQFIRNATKYEFVPKITRIYLDDNDEPEAIMDWISDILL